MSGKGKFSITKKVYFLTILLVGFILIPAISFAQDLPCNGDDPYGNCPLDTNVWLLATIALIAGAIFLYKKQKAQHNL